MSRQAAQPAQPLLQELWQTKAWRLFPLLFMYMTGLTLLIPHVPGIMNDYFAQRRAGHTLRCDELPKDAPALDAAACRDAHADVVLWSSWTSFFSNSLVSIVLTPLLGHWSDLHGRKPFFLVAQACSCIPLTIVLLYLTYDVPLLWYYVVQVFISSLSSVTVSLAFIADLLSPANRTATFGLIMAMLSVSVIVGPAAGAAIDPITAALAALAVVGTCALYTLFILPESLSPQAIEAARTRQEQQQQQQQQQQREAGGSSSALQRSASGVVATSTLRAARILLRSPLFKRLTLCMMLLGVVSEGLQDLLIQYLKLKLPSFGVADVSHIFMIFGACGLLVQTVVLPNLLRWLGEQRVLVVSLAASSVQQLILAAAPTKNIALLGLGVGSLGSMSFPTISSMKSINSQEHEQGSVQGALYGARALASGTGPLLFALLFALFTKTDSPLPYFPGAPFVFGFVLMLVAMAVASTIPSNAGGSAGSIEARHVVPVGGEGSGDGEALLHKSSRAQTPSEDGAGIEAAALWPSAGLTVRRSRDLEGGGSGSGSGSGIGVLAAAGEPGGVSDRSRLSS